MSHPVVPPESDGGYPPVPGHGHYGLDPRWTDDVSDWPTRVDGPPVTVRPGEAGGWWDEVAAPPGPAGPTAYWAPAPGRPDHDEPWPDPHAAWAEPPGHPGPAAYQEPAPAPPARRRTSAGRMVLHIGLAVLVGLGVFALKSALFGDRTRHAAAGDCVATGDAAPTRQRTEAKVVPCDAADARFTVAGRVDGTTGTDGPVCDRFFQPEEQFWVYSSEASGGYVLCLRPKG